MSQNVSRRELILVLIVSLTVALVSARPYAGGWNDGSRLALVESLVDFRTLSIDRSIFVDPARAEEAEAKPYPSQKQGLMEGGTLDKVLIKGRFYSDKAMVPALFMAAFYQVLAVDHRIAGPLTTRTVRLRDDPHFLRIGVCGGGALHSPGSTESIIRKFHGACRDYQFCSGFIGTRICQAGKQP